MNVTEFMNRLDNLYKAMDVLEERLKLHANGEALSEGAHYILGHKVKDLIKEYFEEEK